ncbi:GspE/PulE family protein [Patescibacteria group bacterium]
MDIHTRTKKSYQRDFEPSLKIEKSLESYDLQKQEQFAQNKANSLGFAYINLIGKHVAYSVLSLIPKSVAEKYQILPYTIRDGRFWIAAVDPENQNMIAEVIKLAKPRDLDISFIVVSAQSIKYGLKNYDNIIPQKLPEKELKIQDTKARDLKQEISSLSDIQAHIKQVSTSKLLDALLSGAIQVNSSDVHIEPKEKTMRIRFRIDGVLHTVVELPYDSYKLLRSRIKFLAKLKLDLVKAPQDGQFISTLSGNKIDIRVSSLPTVYGENLVLRLLIQKQKFFSLSGLGFNKTVERLVEEAISKPHGMVLNTGPTGSGKTTTLYAILERLNKPGVKIITLEDPVEYRLPGVNQSQVDPENEYDFADGIRSVVRQDPDIIMIGEMRDKQTAKIGIQAAQTGHLVLSTLHTNNAVATIVRLIEMGVEPYLMPGAINLIIAQRLVRKICTNCREEYGPSAEILSEIKQVWQKIPKNIRGDSQVPDKLWRSRGCNKCNNTGYLGRIVIAEAFKPDKEIEGMLISRASTSEIQKKAEEKGMITILQDGVLKVLQGITTYDEINRVARE